MFLKRIISFLCFLAVFSFSTQASTAAQTDVQIEVTVEQSIMDQVLDYVHANVDINTIRFFFGDDLQLQEVEKSKLFHLDQDLIGFVHEDLLGNPNAYPPIATTYFHGPSTYVYLELIHNTHYHYYNFDLDSFTEQVPVDFETRFLANNWDCPALAAIQFPDELNLAYIAFCKD